MNTTSPMQAAIAAFSKLPSIGPKTASRLAFAILNRPYKEAEELANAILAIKELVHTCQACHYPHEFGPNTLCSICMDTGRKNTICVVAEAQDVMAVERCGAYGGNYFVLGGLIQPSQGIGPRELHTRDLVTMVGANSPTEVILAMNTSHDGETTATYLANLLAPLVPKVTKIGRGMPVGGDIDYIDEPTLTKAIEGRMQLNAN